MKTAIAMREDKMAIEYIDREKAKRLLHIEYAYAAEQLLDEIPAADVAPVVRCKDCKHYRNYPNGLCYLHTEPKTNARGYSGEAVCKETGAFIVPEGWNEGSIELD